MENERQRLQELAARITRSGLRPLEIARACRLDKRTVQRALRCEPLKSDATARIGLYLDRHEHQIPRT